MLGEYYLGMGDGDKALAEFASLSNEHPKDLVTKKGYIELLLAKNRVDEATKLNEEILKSNPKDIDAQILKASIMIGNGKSQDAIPMLEAALKAQSDNAVGHLQLGKAYQGIGNADRAEAEWREAARLNPNMLHSASDPQEGRAAAECGTRYSGATLAARFRF